MKKLIAVAIFATMAVAMLAGPVAADTVPAEVGVFQGTAAVGKTAPPADCSANPTGPGLGFPVLSEAGKEGFYRLNTTVTSVWHGEGTLNICGDLSPALGLGAACGMSSSTGGEGTLDMDGRGGDPLKDAHSHDISNVTWPATAGGTIVAQGDVDNGAQQLVAVVQAQGGADRCSTKSSTGTTSSDKTGGSNVFTVVGTAVIA